MKPRLKRILDTNFLRYGHLSDAQVMAMTIWGEARGEPRDGKIAVGSVILERVEHRKWDGQTIKEVCFWPYQFSCYLDADPNVRHLMSFAADFDQAAKENKALAECYEVAQGILDGSIPRDADIVRENACQYLTSWCKKVMTVPWWKDYKFVKKIGGHEFYA